MVKKKKKILQNCVSLWLTPKWPDLGPILNPGVVGMSAKLPNCVVWEERVKWFLKENLNAFTKRKDTGKAEITVVYYRLHYLVPWILFGEYPTLLFAHRHLSPSKIFQDHGIEKGGWNFLVVQWLRICLPMQGSQVWLLVWEDSTSHGTTKPMLRNYWAHAP